MIFAKWQEYSLGSHALEAVDIVLACINGVRLVVLVTLPHAAEHLTGGGVLHVEGSATEVGVKEVGEGGHLLLLSNVADSLEGVWWHEENWGSNSELGHFRIGKHTDRHHVSTLEGVTGDERGVSVVYSNN